MKSENSEIMEYVKSIDNKLQALEVILFTMLVCIVIITFLVLYIVNTGFI